MPYSSDDDPLSDLDKIRQSLSLITSISSIDDVLSAFGLLDMPRAQRIGIAFGVLTFALTIAAVLSLLTLGGTWKRIEQQARVGASASAPDSVTQRKRRALLMERLLEGRDWMMETNYPPSGSRGEREGGEEGGGEGDGMAKKKNGDATLSLTPLTRMLMMAAPTEGGGMPEGYEANYKAAYRRCQDKPGGG